EESESTPWTAATSIVSNAHPESMHARRRLPQRLPPNREPGHSIRCPGAVRGSRHAFAGSALGQEFPQVDQCGIGATDVGRHGEGMVG
ncbi:hypothetical protein, partial [Salmonella enterica]|uniref:hypothetical protein n=1 Tax=Salmonella enterica TaxID=28901 RepID=UPI0032979223